MLNAFRYTHEFSYRKTSLMSHLEIIFILYTNNSPLENCHIFLYKLIVNYYFFNTWLDDYIVVVSILINFVRVVQQQFMDATLS